MINMIELKLLILSSGFLKYEEFFVNLLDC